MKRRQWQLKVKQANCLKSGNRGWPSRDCNITKVKRALWLVNLVSTICPWVYAADVSKCRLVSARFSFFWSSKISVLHKRELFCYNLSMLCHKADGKHQFELWMHSGSMLGTQQARVALGYRVARFPRATLTLLCAWRPPACIPNLTVYAVVFTMC